MKTIKMYLERFGKELFNYLLNRKVPWMLESFMVLLETIDAINTLILRVYLCSEQQAY